MKHAWKQFVAAPIVFAVGAAMAAEGSPPGDKPLVVNGELSLTTIDFDAYMERVPAARRSEFRAEFEKINPTVDGLWVRRVLAARAAAAGMDKDPLVVARIRLAREDLLAEAYMNDFVKKIRWPDLEPRARELYKAHPRDFMTPDIVTAQHILVSTKTYSKDAAKSRAEEVFKRASAGEDFVQLAAEFSDNKGSREINAMPLTAFEKPLPEAVSKLQNPGDITPPVETQYGFHIIKLKSKLPGRLKPFDEVKEGLIEAEKGKIIDEERTAMVEAIRSDPKTTLHVENVRGLKSDFKIDAETVKNAKQNIRY